MPVKTGIQNAKSEIPDHIFHMLDAGSPSSVAVATTAEGGPGLRPDAFLSGLRRAGVVRHDDELLISSLS
jgi:hypothetical protein